MRPPSSIVVQVGEYLYYDEMSPRTTRRRHWACKLASTGEVAERGAAVAALNRRGAPNVGLKTIGIVTTGEWDVILYDATCCKCGHFGVADPREDNPVLSCTSSSSSSSQTLNFDDSEHSSVFFAKSCQLSICLGCLKKSPDWHLRGGNFSIHDPLVTCPLHNDNTTTTSSRHPNDRVWYIPKRIRAN